MRTETYIVIVILGVKHYTEVNNPTVSTFFVVSWFQFLSVVYRHIY